MWVPQFEHDPQAPVAVSQVRFDALLDGPDLLPLQLNLAKALAKAGRGAEARTQLDTLLPRLKEGTPLHGEALALQKTL